MILLYCIILKTNIEKAYWKYSGQTNAVGKKTPMVYNEQYTHTWEPYVSYATTRKR